MGVYFFCFSRFYLLATLDVSIFLRYPGNTFSPWTLVSALLLFAARGQSQSWEDDEETGLTTSRDDPGHSHSHAGMQ